MKTLTSLSIAVTAFASALAALTPATAQNRDRVQVERAPVDRVQAGTLVCDISAGLGLIIGSRKELACVFTPSQPGPREVYVGSITNFGLDLGITTGGTMAWAVFAPTTRRFGSLAGRYGGAGAEATVGIGAGVNVLVGGSDRTVSLQPLSIEGNTGLNVAAGVIGIELLPAR